MDNYIKMPNLKPYYLYKIAARNAAYGIWLPDDRGFAISRIKFGDNFMFVEYHWDCEAWATAAPLSEVEKSPFVKEDFEYVEKERENGNKYHDYRKHGEIVAYLNKFEGTAEQRASERRR